MEYLQKIEQNPSADPYWNVPEVKQGSVSVVGGQSQNFRTPVKIAEFLLEKYPVKTVSVILPDALQGKIPPLPGVVFAKSTEVGSLADGEELGKLLNAADFGILAGDLSRHSVTAKAIASACEISVKPLLITRDSLDLLTENLTETLMIHENLILLATLPQLMKLLRAIYYPKMLTLSQSLVQVAETLHKFTLSYPSKIVTLHNNQILIVENGMVTVVAMENSGFSPLTIWGGELAGKIAALNLYNPNNFAKATVAAIFS